MKATTIYLDENKIELFNSLLGNEMVKVNGEQVSYKFSIWGAKHRFKIIENGQEIDCELITGTGLFGLAIDLYKDEQPIIKSQKFGCLVWLLISFVGFALYKLLISLL